MSAVMLLRVRNGNVPANCLLQPLVTFQHSPALGLKYQSSVLRVLKRIGGCDTQRLMQNR